MNTRPVDPAAPRWPGDYSYENRRVHELPCVQAARAELDREIHRLGLDVRSGIRRPPRRLARLPRVRRAFHALRWFCHDLDQAVVFAVYAVILYLIGAAAYAVLVTPGSNPWLSQ